MVRGQHPFPATRAISRTDIAHYKSLVLVVHKLKAPTVILGVGTQVMGFIDYALRLGAMRIPHLFRNIAGTQEFAWSGISTRHSLI